MTADWMYDGGVPGKTGGAAVVRAGKGFVHMGRIAHRDSEHRQIG
jgi:hypothetical protein